MYLNFEDKIWGANLADMQLISNAIRKSGLCYVLLIFTANKHELFCWKKKKDVTVTNAFQTILDESGCKANKIWLNQALSFTIYYWSKVYMKITLKCIQHTAKKNLPLLRDLSEP